MDNVQFCAFYAHMLVYINDYKSNGIDFVYLNLVNIMKCATLFSRTTPQKPKRGLYKNWNLLGWPCVVSTAIQCNYSSTLHKVFQINPSVWRITFHITVLSVSSDSLQCLARNENVTLLSNYVRKAAGPCTQFCYDLAKARDDTVGTFQAVGDGMITRIERCCVRLLLSHDFRFWYE